MAIISFRINRMNFKLLVAFVFFILFTVIPIGWISINEQEHLIRNYVNNTNDAFANFIASHVQNAVSRTKDILNIYSSLPAMLQMDKDAITEKLNILIADDALFSGAGVYDHTKKLIARTENFYEISNLENLFSQTLLHQHGVSLFENLKTRSQNFSKPGNDAEFRTIIHDGQFIVGALIVQLNKQYFQNSLNEIKVFFEYSNEYSTIYILDETQKIIASSKDSPMPMGSIFPPHLMFEEIYIKELQDYYISHETPPWKIIFVPKSSAYDNIVGFKKTFFWFMLVYIVLAALFGGFVADKITRPLRKLVLSTEKISEGLLDNKIVPESNDEIGELASKFDIMRCNLRSYQNSLKQKIVHLETLYHVGTIVSQELKYQNVLRTILDTVVDVMAAEKGSIMLLDHKSGELKIAMAKGLNPEVIKKTAIVSGESVAGHVFATQQPMLVMDTMKNDIFQRLKKKKVSPGTMLSVPLISKEKSIGVLNISKSMPYGFSDYDLDLFRAIANLCATSIDNARLYEMAITDELTSLYTRRYFHQSINFLANLQNKPFSLIMMDIDHFKKFNDTHGHSCGDKVLVLVSELMQKSLRDDDIAFRIGGEEFAILCPGQNANAAKIPAERLRHSISEYKISLISGEEISVTVSMGIAEYPQNSNEINNLFELADKSLYHSKAQGRNRITLYSEIETTEKNSSESKTEA